MARDRTPDLPIPFGWYCVGYGDELSPGEIRPLRYFGRDLVLFRTESGSAHLLDAYCPHLGAHLGPGAIEGEGLRCPFHAWKFDGEGRCVDIPYSGRIPALARDGKRLASHPLVEQDGFLWAWYHPHGAAPIFPLHRFEEIGSGAWTDYERHEWQIETHVQEAGENAVDAQHFVSVHEAGDLLGKAEISFDRHRRASDLAMQIVRFSEEDGGKPDGYVEGRVLSMSSGPGQTWTRQLGITDMLIIGLPTPVERGRLHLRFAISVPRDQADTRKVLSQLITRHAVKQVEEDIPIWERKIYRPTPLLCDGDGPIAQYREWFSQFYAEASGYSAASSAELS